jgi:hypothetical protein
MDDPHAPPNGNDAAPDDGAVDSADHGAPDTAADATSDTGPDLLPPTLPSRAAFLLAFLSVVVAGVFGGIIGYGLVDVGCTGSCQTPKLGATLGGAMLGAGGVGIVAVLVLRAMAEWKRPRQE